MLSTAQELDGIIAKLTRDPYRDLPRLVVMAARKDDAVVYSGAGGYAQLPEQPTEASELAKRGEPADEDSVFELYSCTKLPAVIAGLQLVEQGKLALDDDASKYIPELKNVKVFKGTYDAQDQPECEPLRGVVTIHMLLTHTSGSYYPFFDPAMGKLATKLPGKGMVYSAGNSKETLFEIPFAAQPGEKFRYGYSLDYLTLIVEQISGLTLEQYFQQNIFRPLGIQGMSFAPNPKQMSMALENPEATDGVYAFRKNDPMSETQHFGGAGLKGSPKEYLKIVRAILRGGEFDGNRILRQETVDLMFKEQLSTDEQRKSFHVMAKVNFDPSIYKAGGEVDESNTHGYGGGLHSKTTTGKSQGTLSWSGMANTYWACDREQDLAFVVFTNLLPTGTPRVMEGWHAVEQKLYEGLKR
ncbi:hypothetical protein JCM8202_003631 [Rhodotorula sphaerocarpa]